MRSAMSKSMSPTSRNLDKDYLPVHLLQPESVLSPFVVFVNNLRNPPTNILRSVEICWRNLLRVSCR